MEKTMLSNFFKINFLILFFSTLPCQAQSSFFECAKEPQKCKGIVTDTEKKIPSAINSPLNEITQGELAQIKRLAEQKEQEAEMAKKEMMRLKNQLDQVNAQNKKDEQQITYRAGRRIAFVVGNNHYQNVSRLDTAKLDAISVGKALEEAGFKINLHTDLNEKSMKLAMRDFKTQVQKGDEVVVFFAGHGVQIGGVNYLLPTDIQGDNEEQIRDEAIQLQRILDDMHDRGAGFTLALIDACRDNPFRQQGRSIGGRGLAPTAATTGQMIIFSAGSGQQALDKLYPTDPVPNGVFTRVLLREMLKPKTSIDRVMRNVRQEVVQLAKSVGKEQTPALYDQAVGDFYFKP